MKEAAGLTDGWVCSQANPRPSNPKPDRVSGTNTKASRHRGKGEGGAGHDSGREATKAEKREKECRRERLHRNGIQNRTKSKRPQFSNHPSIPFFPSYFSARHANGMGSLLQMEKIITVSYIRKLQTKAGITMPLLKWRLSLRWD